MKIILIPLIEDANATAKRNPSDIRRIDLLAKNLGKHGLDCFVITKQALLKQSSDMIITQSRDYKFWVDNQNIIKANTKKIVFTCSDAIGGTFSAAHNTSSRKNVLEHDFLENICDVIVVGSDRQKEIIENLGVTTKIVVIEDYIDKDTYKYQSKNLPKKLPKKPVSIFWEGYIDNVPYLENCAEAIKELSKEYDLKVYLLTSKQRRSPYLGTTDNAKAIQKLFGDVGIFVEWNDANVQKYMSICHIGIAPLFQDDQFAMAKPANKLIIYNYMGLYAVASATPAYKKYIGAGGAGVIVQEDNWLSSFEEAFEKISHGSTRENAHEISNRYFSDEVLTQKYLDYCQIQSIADELSTRQHFNTDSRFQKESDLPHIAYLLPCIAISGGIAVVLKHANLLLERGYKVTIVVKQPYEGDLKDWFQCAAPIVNLNEGNRQLLNGIDILVATSWNTADEVLLANVPRKIYFVQSDERRFVNDSRLKENIHRTYLLNLEYMTEAVWIQRWLKDEFSHDAYFVPNGIDESLFFHIQGRKSSKKKRVLIEGAIDFPYKGMFDAYNAVKDIDCELWIISSRGEPPKDWQYDKFFTNVPMAEMKNIYSSCDVFLKMSRVEGFFGPPLEAMACKCSVVVAKCTGHDEYIEHGSNALVVEMGDIDGARKAVTTLLGDDNLRESFIKNGLKTVQNWSWDNSANYLESAMRKDDVKVLYTDAFPDVYTYDPAFDYTISALKNSSSQDAVKDEEVSRKLTVLQSVGATIFLVVMSPILSRANKRLIKNDPRGFFVLAKHPVSVWVGKVLKLR